MAIDHCLITAAGLGTRMGEIGKRLPKILWPVFDTTLLELQIKFAELSGAKNIFLNGHFLSPQVRNYIKERNLPVTFVHEEVLLDVGGAIYNVASLPEVNHQGTMLVLNGDQFLFFDQEKLRSSINLLDQYDGVLFGIKVPGGAGYRETKVQDGRLIDIVAAHHQTDSYQTYSGVSLFNLEKIEKRAGVQPFFDSIANYRSRPLAFIPLDDYHYWDFGTATRYAHSLFSILKAQSSAMALFLDQYNGWDRRKLGNLSYNAGDGIINMGLGDVSSKSAGPSIILASHRDECVMVEKSSLSYYDLRAGFEG